MKPFWKDLLYACIMGLIVPWMVLSVGVAMFGEEPHNADPTVAEIYQETAQLTVPILTEDGIIDMELDDYLVGVVLAEMPASFEQEAQKAQAVVARTYTMRAHLGAGKHEKAAVCTDSACCQGYISEEAYLEKGGSEEGIEKIRQAVQSTTGYVLTYEGKLIEATYFSCSGGQTEDALAVWGTDVPYLRSVESPGEENATHYTDTVTFTPDEFCSALSIPPEGKPEKWFGEISYTTGGGVESIEICGESYSGTELRRLLELRSTAFSIDVTSDSITIKSRGYGHRVGMSQYGADAMAASGSDYSQILQHYYQGTSLVRLPD